MSLPIDFRAWIVFIVTPCGHHFYLMKKKCDISERKRKQTHILSLKKKKSIWLSNFKMYGLLSFNQRIEDQEAGYVLMYMQTYVNKKQLLYVIFRKKRSMNLHMESVWFFIECLIGFIQSSTDIRLMFLNLILYICFKRIWSMRWCLFFVIANHFYKPSSIAMTRREMLINSIH